MSEWLRNSFLGVQEVLAKKLDLAHISIAHAPTQGGVVENHWMEVFRAYLPKRYQVDTGIVVDSRGARSEQIDIVIYDEQYTPVLLDQGGHRYIPVEAVYAVFESKPHIDKGHLEYAGKKASSVRKMYCTSVSIRHAGGAYPPKTPVSIMAGIVAPKAAWADGLGVSFEENLPKDESEKLNCGCALTHGAFDSFDGDLIVFNSDGVLMYFLFRLLGKLQSLGTVPAIDWVAYAKILK